MYFMYFQSCDSRSSNLIACFPSCSLMVLSSDGSTGSNLIVSEAEEEEEAGEEETARAHARAHAADLPGSVVQL